MIKAKETELKLSARSLHNAVKWHNLQFLFEIKFVCSFVWGFNCCNCMTFQLSFIAFEVLKCLTEKSWVLPRNVSLLLSCNLFPFKVNVRFTHMAQHLSFVHSGTVIIDRAGV